MSILQQVNEKSTIWLTAAFFDKDDVAVEPAGVQYRIDSGGTQIKDWTALTPGETVEITITSAENAMLDANKVLERRLVSVKATFGAGDEHNEQYEYLVKNLSAVT